MKKKDAAALDPYGRYAVKDGQIAKNVALVPKKPKIRSKFYLRVKYQNGEYVRYLMPSKEYAYGTMDEIEDEMLKGASKVSFEYGTTEERAIISLEGILSITVVRDPDNRQIR